MLEESKPYYALSKFQSHYATKIIRSALIDNVSDNLADFFQNLPSKLTKKWVLQCTGYGLQMCDDEIFITSFCFYIELLSKYAKTVDKVVLRTIIMDLSNVFANKSFDSSLALKLHSTIEKIFVLSSFEWPFEIKRILIDFLLYATLCLKNDPLSEKYGSLALDLFCRYNPNDESAYNYFSPAFNKLFKFDYFCKLWIRKFEVLYREIISLMTTNTKNTAFNYFVQQINEKFDQTYKGIAFSMIIYTYSYATTDRFTNSIYPIQQICDNYLHWFNPLGSFHNQANIEQFYTFHPLFKLAEQSKYGDNENLDSIIENYILSIIRSPIGSEITEYWFFPLHSYRYLLTWPNFSLYVEDFKNYFQNMFDFFNDSQKMTSIIAGIFQKYDQSKQKIFEKIKTEIMISTVTILNIASSIDYEHEDFYKSVIFEISKKSQPCLLYSLLNLFQTGRSNDFWMFLISDILLSDSIFMITAASSINICGSEFYTEYKRKVEKIVARYTQLLNESKFTDDNEISRIIFSFIQIASCTSFFTDNQLMYEKISHSEVGKRKDLPILEMLHLAVISGGGDLEEADPDITIKGDNYATPKYTFSVYKDKLLIRHPIGCNLYIIQDANEYEHPPSNLTELLETKSKNSKPIPLSKYRSKEIFDMETEQALLMEESLINTSSEIISYEFHDNFADKENSAHKFVSDMNITVCHPDSVRLIEDYSPLLQLDSHKMEFGIFIAQLTLQDNFPKFGHCESGNREIFMRDLCNGEEIIKTPSANFRVMIDVALSIPDNIRTSKSADFVHHPQKAPNIIRSPMIVILNETGLSPDPDSIPFRNFNAIVEIVMNENDFGRFPYIAHVSFQNEVLETEKMLTKTFSIMLPAQGLCPFILMIATIMNSSRSFFNCGKSLTQRFTKKKKDIMNIFKEANPKYSSFILHSSKVLNGN